ncbi:hybrid sensor histidine kinase/response regulator [Salibacteraceae bacterium]|nr:hybrid sensor histidine kinase/response regulator [Salibacteraceae bacterium]
MHSFRANFRKDYEVYKALTSKEGYQLIELHDIPVILSDYKMPEENGVLFLEKVKENFPFTVRIMLTGHADMPAVVDAINKGGVFRFLPKPWNEEVLRNSIENAFDIYLTKNLLGIRNEELKKAYAELDKLVFSTAHDITGPLSNIMGLVTLIRMDDSNSAEYVDLIEHTAKKLKLIARDVLSFHRNKRTGINLRDIRLNQLIKTVMNEHQFFENSANINYTLEVYNDQKFVSDKSRLRFILNNLLSNAIKYQDREKKENKINILANVNSSELKLTVEDNGIGIDLDRQSKIFDIYYRGTNLSNGTGIGLYIVKEAVDLLEGNIELTSIIGQGTKFIITIPNLFGAEVKENN